MVADTPKPQHKPDCAKMRPPAPCAWNPDCTCGADKPAPPAQVKEHDHSDLTDGAGPAGKAMRFITNPSQPTEDGPGEEDGPWAEGWKERCGKTPPAPTADAVREARMAITAHFNHTEPCRTLEAHVHTLLAALSQAQGEAKNLKRGAQDDGEYMEAQVGELKILRAENARLVAERDSALNKVGKMAEDNIQKHIDLTNKNAAQAEQIKRLRQALERIRDDVGYFDTAVAVATQALKSTAK